MTETSDDLLTGETYLEMMRMSGGTLCCYLQRIGAVIYFRWNSEATRFEWCSIAGPAGTVMMYEPVYAAKIKEVLDIEERRRPVYPVRYDETPFPKIPALADEYEEQSFTLREAYRAVCGCGDSSIAHPARRQAKRWADDHRDMCEFLSNRERSIEIEHLDPQTQEADTA